MSSGVMATSRVNSRQWASSAPPAFTRLSSSYGATETPSTVRASSTVHWATGASREKSYRAESM